MSGSSNDWSADNAMPARAGQVCVLSFYYATTGSLISSFPVSKAFILRSDRKLLETGFIYLVARKVGLPAYWITLSLPVNLDLSIRSELRVSCTLSHPIVEFDPHESCCCICGDSREVSGVDLWYSDADACIRCDPCDLCCFCIVLLPQVTQGGTSSIALCLACVEDDDDIQFSAMQKKRYDALVQYWDFCDGQCPSKGMGQSVLSALRPDFIWV